MAALPGLPGSHHHNKITKPRSVVKPILKKLSHSEKNSLDLDRGWEEQPVGNGFVGVYETAGGDRSSRDLGIQFGYAEKGSYGGGGGHGAAGGAGLGGGGAGVGAGAGVGVGNGGGGGGAAIGGGGRAKYHGRSASGASHGSAGTNGSGHHHRVGSFVHPFQQTPRTSTPPLSYANSLASFDNGPRDYSPTITENEDDDEHRPSFSHAPHPPAAGTSLPQSLLRRPSLASERTDSFSDIAPAPTPQLRLNTNTSRSVSGLSSRLAYGGSSTSYSNSDLQLNLSSLDSPSSTGPATVNSPSSASASAMAPLRSSLDSVAFRLRSRSDFDTAAQREDIREARRKFEERERLKEEKYAREQVRKRERKDNKEASRIEKAAAAAAAGRNERRSTGGSSSKSDPIVRPSAAPRKSTSTSLSGLNISAGGPGGLLVKKHRTDPGPGGRSDLAADLNEKQLDFLSSNYESVPDGTTPDFGPGADDVHFRTAPTRKSTAKRKTQGYWTGFILWLRTRLLKLGRRIKAKEASASSYFGKTLDKMKKKMKKNKKDGKKEEDDSFKVNRVVRRDCLRGGYWTLEGQYIRR